ncbi:venom protein 302-like [Hydractinia symbiolongicarpus]|uniref:venom protein 302-like n=1 Tax=Hydractinia symbiolongicarpus TaxID=13093 RepID=UPI00254F4CD2|nr:venom protein 302-like [Hydractinia symbiolongicarpus]
MNHFILFGVLLLQFCHMSHSLSCFQCNLTECKQPMCKGGIVKDPCQCCNVCAKVRGEECGGPWDIHGECDQGLYCKKEGKPGQTVFNITGKCEYHVCEVETTKQKRGRRCKNEEVVFCTKNCKNCCMHNSTCKPNRTWPKKLQICQKRNRNKIRSN